MIIGRKSYVEIPTFVNQKTESITNISFVKSHADAYTYVSYNCLIISLYFCLLIKQLN